MRRRYEAWFLRFALADGSGAWWLRYILLNLGRSGGGGCGGKFRSPGYPVQVWATLFPRGETPQSFIAGFSQGDLAMSGRFASPFSLECSGQRIDENSCRAAIEVGSHRISWDLRYRSSTAYSLSDKGWIGFTRTPHSDAVFSGRITFDAARGRPTRSGAAFRVTTPAIAIAACGRGRTFSLALSREVRGRPAGESSAPSKPSNTKWVSACASAAQYSATKESCTISAA